MAVRRHLRRLLLGRYAIIWMAILTQILWHVYSGTFLDRWMSFNAHGLAFWICYVCSPTRQIAEVGSTALSVLILSVAIFRTIAEFYPVYFLETHGCTLHTHTHYGPGPDTTLELWISGRKCQDGDKQIAMISREISKRMPTMQKETCNRICVFYSDDRATWTSFLTSAPAGHIPSTMHCNAEPWGQCPGEAEASAIAGENRVFTTILSL